MRYRRCRKLHGLEWQGICLAERYVCRFFSIVVHDEYCPVCGKARSKYNIWRGRKKEDVWN